MQRIAIFAGKTTDADQLAKIVGDRGGQVVGVYRVGHHGAGWKALLGHLDAVDTVAIEDIHDLIGPIRSLNELLSALARLHDESVSLFVARSRIDTQARSAADLLALMIAFKQAKRSKAIRQGQERAVAAGRKVGRPEVRPKLRQRIADAVAAGGGIRPTAKRFGVSPGTVINISRSTLATALAA